MEPVDLLIEARWVVPVEPRGAILEHHSVAVDGGRIAACLPSAEAGRRYRPARQVRCLDHALIPGLVNAHTHAPMTLLRGFADDLPLMDWLQGHIWPAERRWVDAGFVAAGADLAIAEMLRSGTTCFNDMYFHPDIVADRAQRAGIRACVGLIVLDFPTQWAADGGEYINRGLDIHDRVRSDLIETAFAPHAPYTVSDETLRRVRILADELDIPVQMHVHETAAEVEESMSRFGCRPLERLATLGLLTPRLQAVHMTQLLRQEIAALAAAGVHVIHCPQSNLKLASGFAEVQAMLDAGVNVAIGTDGAASNNDLDMLDETRTAALLAKGRCGDPTAMPADRALEAATLGGALAMGLGERIGSIVAGKEADLVAIDLSGIESRPVYDVASAIVYSGSSSRISDVWVAGRHVVERGGLTTMDLETLAGAAADWGSRIAGRSRAAAAGG